ncbi:hypothetical protein [Microvirga tunisiensis]|uniref:Single-stranded DNA-binding protein n=1 Tax=Microvirga tunisiensis TaxID=2108360 RepID=A0A5N7MUI3_9HYPH|nr:hypothetical protein [Microvirga tunisiensis]MPR12193.1 hypothetical protein [Microvirga tunisiensis]MPR30139.1 hypothetical protein [Microvirga tunisiensis]
MSQNTAPVAATQASTQSLYNRRMTVSALTVGTDKKGRPFATFRGQFVSRRTGKKSSIFCQVFGQSYQGLKDMLVNGNEIAVFGAHETLPANEEKGLKQTRAFRVIGKSTPKPKAEDAAA